MLVIDDINIRRNFSIKVSLIMLAIVIILVRRIISMLIISDIGSNTPIFYYLALVSIVTLILARCLTLIVSMLVWKRAVMSQISILVRNDRLVI